MYTLEYPKLSFILLLMVAIGHVHPSYPPHVFQYDNRDDIQERLYQVSMDTNVQPCEDFYRYACGNWRSDSEKDYQETLTKLDYEINNEMAYVLQTLHQNNFRENKIVREVNNYYKSCTDNEVPETVEYLKWLVSHERRVQWPISGRNSSPYNSPSYDWIRMLATLRKYGMNDVILHESASPKELNPNMLAIELGRPHADKNHFNTLRYDVVTGTLRFFMSQQEYQGLWSDIQDMDNKLLELHTKYEQEDEVVFTTVGGLSDVPWLQQYLSVLLDMNNLDPNMELVITNISYLKAVVAFMQRHHNKFICEYLQVKFLSYLNHKQFKSEYRDCVTSTRLLFPLPMQWLYEQQHGELQHEIPNINMIFTNLKQSFLRILNRNVYNFDQSMRKFLRAKLRTLQLRMGFLTSQSLDQFYGNLTLDATDYYGNRLNIYKYYFKAAHSHLNTRLNRNSLEFLPLEEYDTAHTLLPYLLPRQRALLVPLSILQYPYYRPEQSNAYLYSSIGYLMARQIMWEFTITDLEVSAYGQVFSYMLDMLIENPQFKADYDHIEHYHRGETEEVDSAINGLKLAYQAFREREQDDSMTRSFFLNFAQMYCGTIDASYHRPSLATKNQKIVNFAVTHIGAFSRTFGCKRQPVHGILYWGSQSDN